jgi:hypothetical protein
MRRFVLSAPLILAACAGSTAPDAPSLLPRAIESRSDAEPFVPVSSIAPDPTLDSRIAERVAAFAAASKAFAMAQPGLATRIDRAKGAAEGSERWIDGQGAIGELQQTRTAADGAMADLERLAIERASAGAPPYPVLDAAIASAQVELNRQAEIEAQLKATLGA